MSSIHSLHVGNLHSGATEVHLFEMFSQAGPVSIRVCRDIVTCRSLGHGYVNFLQLEHAETAQQTMNGKMLLGQPMRVTWSERNPSRRRSGVGNVVVKNLDSSVDHEILQDTFKKFGRVISCDIHTKNGTPIGFVQFDNESAAKLAIEKGNGLELNGRKVVVEKFYSKRERKHAGTSCINANVFVKNFGDDMTDEELREAFGEFGKITSAKVEKDPKTGKSKGFGFVNYETPEAATEAIKKMSGSALKGHEIYCALHQKKEERRAEQGMQPGVAVYVRNLEDEIDDQRLFKEFSTCGNVTKATVAKDEAGYSKGFGFVTFVSCEDAERAMREMSGRTIISKPLLVDWYRSKEERESHWAAMVQSLPKVYVQQPPVPVQSFAHGLVPNSGMMVAQGLPYQNHPAAHPAAHPATSQGLSYQNHPAAHLATYPQGLSYQNHPAAHPATSPQGLSYQNHPAAHPATSPQGLSYQNHPAAHPATSPQGLSYQNHPAAHPATSPQGLSYQNHPAAHPATSQGLSYQNHPAAHPATSQGLSYQNHPAAHPAISPQGLSYQNHPAAHPATSPQGLSYQNHLAAHPAASPQGLSYQNYMAAQTYQSLEIPAPLHIPPSGFQASGGNVTAGEYFSPMYMSPSYTRVPRYYPSIVRPTVPMNASCVGQSQDIPTPPRPNIVGMNGGLPWSPPSFQLDTESPTSPQFGTGADITGGSLPLSLVQGQREGSQLNTSSNYSHPALQEEPELPHLMNLVAAHVPDKFYQIGIQLGLGTGTLNAIASSPHAMERFSKVFSDWQKQQNKPYKWLTVINVLEAPSIGENSLAQYIVDKLTK